jgi:hypothetical protein
VTEPGTSGQAGAEQSSPVPSQSFLDSLQERAKELNCLYEIEEILSRPGAHQDDILHELVMALPKGWQHPPLCAARLVLEQAVYVTPGFSETRWSLSAPILAEGQTLGRLDVCYLRPCDEPGEAPFLPEESRLINAIAERLGHYLQHQQLKRVLQELERAARAGRDREREEWRGAVHLLQVTDPELSVRIARRMVRLLCFAGVPEALAAMERHSDAPSTSRGLGADLSSQPEQKRSPHQAYYQSDEPFELAARHLPAAEILEHIQRWMLEEKFSFLTRVLNSQKSSLKEITAALRRSRQKTREETGLSDSTLKGLRVSLIRRFLTDDLRFIETAKEHIRVIDFVELVDRIVYPSGSHGKVGGKSAGVFVAKQLLERSCERVAGDFGIKYPRSWYVASDGLSDFVEHNDLLEWIMEQKYKPVEQVRQEYPLLVQLFKNSSFSAEMVRGLSMALDDLRGRPLIVRSSSLGEDRSGTAFSGKYKSLFLANLGSKAERLEALLDAVAEVYASAFGPEPIEYRRERGLLDFDEEMAILLQEVVGVRAGRYYLPAFSGVAFSNNELRWSPRIERGDGLIRMVPGLGTRAVDRVGDDYPILLAPGKPGLRAAMSVEEQSRYSPRKIDAIDLESNTFVTLSLPDLLREPGFAFPAGDLVFSVLQADRLTRFSSLLAEPDRDELVVTFEGLFQDTTFTGQINRMLELLQERLGTAVDIEFASDGKDLYLLQCRSQSSADEWAPSPIPRDVPEADLLFRAVRFVSNGRVADISHVVYVDPAAYAGLESEALLTAVARAVGRLNARLPRRRFALFGPGRWGSRGNLELGVNVSYSEINNTALLVEIARPKDGYLPDLSFGTHFFQDLVESSIRYLPLYPEEPGGLLNEQLLLTAPNHLATLAPEYACLADVVRVVDLPQVTGGRVLRTFMNAEEGEAVGVLLGT